MIVCRLVANFRAKAETLDPIFKLFAHALPQRFIQAGGRPRALPEALACCTPDWVRSIGRSRSNSATALMTPIVSLRVELVRSTPPRVAELPACSFQCRNHVLAAVAEPRIDHRQKREKVSTTQSGGTGSPVEPPP